MVLASQMRAGMAIVFENQTYRVIAAEYHPGQGRMSGVTHARLQNIQTGTFWEHSFRGELRLADIPIERQTLQFLYMDGQQCCFMDPGTYEQTEIPNAIVGPRAVFLEPGMNLPVEFVSGRAIAVIFPDAIEVRIADTAPASHQQTDSAFKRAQLANGVEVMVPQFIKTGDMIRLDLAALKYMDRAKAKGQG